MNTIQICVGVSCAEKGSYHVINRIQELVENNKLTDKIDVNSMFCRNNCANGVSALINDELFSVSMENVDEFFKSKILPLTEASK